MLMLRVCTGCLEGRKPLDHLIEQVEAGGLEGRVAVQAVSCGERCAHPARLWLQAQDQASYLFEGLNLERDTADILATVCAYLDSKDGWIIDARPCGRLRHKLVARLPA